MPSVRTRLAQFRGGRGHSARACSSPGRAALDPAAGTLCEILDRSLHSSSLGFSFACSARDWWRAPSWSARTLGPAGTIAACCGLIEQVLLIGLEDCRLSAGGFDGLSRSIRCRHSGRLHRIVDGAFGLFACRSRRREVALFDGDRRWPVAWQRPRGNASAPCRWRRRGAAVPASAVARWFSAYGDLLLMASRAPAFADPPDLLPGCDLPTPSAAPAFFWSAARLSRCV